MPGTGSLEDTGFVLSTGSTSGEMCCGKKKKKKKHFVVAVEKVCSGSNFRLTIRHDAQEHLNDFTEHTAGAFLDLNVPFSSPVMKEDDLFSPNNALLCRTLACTLGFWL